MHFCKNKLYKMKKFTKLTLVIILAAITSVSCKKDDASSTTPVVNTKISKLEYNDNITEISYNADGTINKMISKEADGTVNGTFSFSYTAGKLSTINYGFFTTRYTYSGNNLAKTELISPLGGVMRTYEYSFANNRLSEQTEFIGSDEPELKIKFSYAGANISKMELNDHINNAWVKTGDIMITSYDTKSNHSALLETVPYIPLTNVVQNNPLEEVHTTQTGEVGMTVKYTYTYDTHGRVTTRTTTESAPGVPDEVSITKYFY